MTVASVASPNAANIAAATATANHNGLCGAPVAPYYWEIGDQNGTVVSGSVGSDSSGKAVTADTMLSIASASKWVYATYVTQVRGAADRLTAQDVNFLHFTSGYTNIDSPGTACPRTSAPNTVNECLTQSNAQGEAFSARDPATTGTFYYNGGHMENHASQMTKLGNVTVNSLGKSMQTVLGSDINITYTQPLMSGGIRTSAGDYALLLRNILSGALAMRDALGTNAVCTRASSTCNAAFSPIKENWHYSIGHWVEDDAKTHGDGAFSSPGAFGFYPWIDQSKKYYGIISRSGSASQSGQQEGYASVQCGRLIRHAFVTATEQTGDQPTD